MKMAAEAGGRGDEHTEWTRVQLAHLYENTTNQKSENKSNSIRISLKGSAGNPQGVGAKIWVYTGKDIRYAEQQLQRADDNRFARASFSGNGDKAWRDFPFKLFHESEIFYPQ